MILSVITVPGTGEMLEIQIERPGPDFVDFSETHGKCQSSIWGRIRVLWKLGEKAADSV